MTTANETLRFCLEPGCNVLMDHPQRLRCQQHQYEYNLILRRQRSKGMLGSTRTCAVPGCSVNIGVLHNQKYCHAHAVEVNKQNMYARKQEAIKARNDVLAPVPVPVSGLSPNAVTIRIPKSLSATDRLLIKMDALVSVSTVLDYDSHKPERHLVYQVVEA